VYVRGRGASGEEVWMARTIYSDVYLNGVVLDNMATQLPATGTGTVIYTR
jgi:hypothetical protein